MKSQIFSAYYHSETGGVGITFVYTTDIETAEEYLDRIFGEALISVQKYVRPERKKNLKKE